MRNAAAEVVALDASVVEQRVRAEQHAAGVTGAGAGPQGERRLRGRQVQAARTSRTLPSCRTDDRHSTAPPAVHAREAPGQRDGSRPHRYAIVEEPLIESA